MAKIVHARVISRNAALCVNKRAADGDASESGSKFDCGSFAPPLRGGAVMRKRD
jgi:hypothetical protein